MSKTKERKSVLRIVNRADFMAAVALQSWEPPSTISATLTWQGGAGRQPTQVSVAVTPPGTGTIQEMTWQNPGAAPVSIMATGTFTSPATSGNILQVIVGFPGSPTMPSDLAIVYENSVISSSDVNPVGLDWV
jgi:hypothetical protein